jgi:predicted nucleotidyltransferase
MIDIEKIKPIIVEQLKPLNPLKIILFGSYAYGKPNEDSDLDIFVIEKSFQNKWAEKRKISDLLDDIDIPKDIMLETEEFFEAHSGSEWINTAWYDAANYGEVLYEKR